MDKTYLPNITSLRGIAAILVAMLHFHFFLGPIVPYEKSGLVDKLYLMVDLFFILSGFIICYIYEEDFNKSISRINYKLFLIARLARIYPLHLITLTAEIFIFLFIVAIGKFHILPDWHQHLYRVDAIPVQLAFLETVGIFNFATWNAPAWSLSAEWWAYVIFPIIVFVFSKMGCRKKYLYSFLAIAGWLTIEFLLSPLHPFLDHPPNPEHHSLDVNWHYGTLRGIVGFIAGMAVWQMYQGHILKRVFGNGWTLFILTIAALLSMQFKFYDTVTVILFGALILSSAYGSRSINKFYSWTVFESLGKWSFSIYIWHMVFINIIMLFYIVNRTEPIKGLLRPLTGSYMENCAYLILFLIFCSLVGYLSYRFVEQPTRQWIKARVRKL